MSYLLIDLKVRKSNMLQGLGILSPTPVLPAVLAMHALDKRLNERLGVQGVGIIHKHCQPWIEALDDKGYLKPALVQRRGAYLFDDEENPAAMPAQPMALADIELTLLLQCRHEVSDPHDVERVLSSMRLAGGDIESDSLRVQSVPDWDDALKKIRHGFWIDDASHEMASGSDPVRALLRATRVSGWMVPANLGYALLEVPRERVGARDGRLHAFAEDMIGLVRYTSLYRARQDGLRPARIWRYGWDGDQFLVTNRAGVLLNKSRAPSFSCGSSANV